MPIRVRASAFVCVHIIKSPDASAHIINGASGRVFRSRTFEMHYMFLVQQLGYPYMSTCAMGNVLFGHNSIHTARIGLRDGFEVGLRIRYSATRHVLPKM